MAESYKVFLRCYSCNHKFSKDMTSQDNVSAEKCPNPDCGKFTVELDLGRRK